MPRKTQVLFGLIGVFDNRHRVFISEMSAPESTKNEHLLFDTLIGTFIKFDADTFIAYTARLFLKKVDLMVAFVLVEQ